MKPSLAILWFVAGCSSAPRPALIAVPRPGLATVMKTAQAVHPPSSEVAIKIAPVVDYGAPMYAGITVTLRGGDLDNLALDGVDDVLPLRSSPLAVWLVGARGPWLFGDCWSPSETRVKVAPRRTGDVVEFKAIKRLDTCFPLAPGRYWVAAAYSPRYAETDVVYTPFSVRLPTKRCTGGDGLEGLSRGFCENVSLLQWAASRGLAMLDALPSRWDGVLRTP